MMTYGVIGCGVRVIIDGPFCLDAIADQMEAIILGLAERPERLPHE